MLYDYDILWCRPCLNSSLHLFLTKGYFSEVWVISYFQCVVLGGGENRYTILCLHFSWESFCGLVRTDGKESYVCLKSMFKKFIWLRNKIISFLMFYIVISDLVLTIECTCCVHEALWCVVTTATEICVVSELQDETGADVIIAVSLMGIVVCYENNQTSKFYRWVSSCDGVRMCDQAVMCGKNVLACKVISKHLRTSVSQRIWTEWPVIAGPS